MGLGMASAKELLRTVGLAVISTHDYDWIRRAYAARLVLALLKS